LALVTWREEIVWHKPVSYGRPLLYCPLTFQDV